MYIYIIYFLLITFLAIEYEFRPFQTRLPLTIIIIGLACLAGFRGPEVGRDYENYLYNFEIVNNIDDVIFLTILEPGFIAIVYLIRLISAQNYQVLIMLFFALSAVALKISVFKRLTINPFLAILIYFSHYFLLHEMTQIRIGLASAFFLCGIPYFLKRNKMGFVGFVLFGTLFHYSAILYLAILLFDARSFNIKLYSGLLIASVILAFMRLPLANYLTSYNGSKISVKIDIYSELGRKGYYDEINVFNPVTIVNLLCCIYFMFFVPRLVLLQSKSLIIFLKCNLLSIFILALLSGVASVAFRFSEIYNVASIFLFTYLAVKLPFGKFNIFLIIFLAACIFYLNAFYGQLVGPYYAVKFK